MEKFGDFANKQEHLILEMPHIMFDTTGKAVDLELEVHSQMKPKEYVQYFKDWVTGKNIESKRPDFRQSISPKEQREFADYVLNQTLFVKQFTLKHYGERVWSRIVSMLEKYL